MGEDEQAIYDRIERQLGRPATATLTIDDAATVVLMRHRIVQFRGNARVKVQSPYEHFVPMEKEVFDQIAYPLVGGMPKTRINDTFAYLSAVAKDVTSSDRYILFGAGGGRQAVWDMKRLEMRADVLPDDCVWRSPYAPILTTEPVKLIMDLAGGSIGVYSDIMQSLAPLVMATKPDGVVWWVGADLSGKDALMRALRKIFPDQLASLTVKQLNGGHSNTPLLNGVLGNVAQDTDSQITNTEIYKSIATHQDFRIHRYHSQHGIEVRGNVHHIFSADCAPAFYAKSLSTDWRTHTVLFSRSRHNQAYTLTNDFLGQLLAEVCKYAVTIKQQGYRYAWSGRPTRLIAA
ncbi:MAG TPA: hypothetical protein VFT87_02530 [Candidatus Saccharimonadales bacterium]|nr:hypothetical protein [Candidatus Saccharimonadales bacterium]